MIDFTSFLIILNAIRWSPYLQHQVFSKVARWNAGTESSSPLTSLGALLILLLTRTVEWAPSPNVARVSYEYNYRRTH